jgi:hypothetical protein
VKCQGKEAFALPSPYSALASSLEAGVSARTTALSPEGRGIKEELKSETLSPIGGEGRSSS